MTLILASASASRRKLLADAGIAFEVQPASIDEDEIKRSLRAEGADAAAVAEALAELKALKISQRYPGCVVIGADQMLDCDGVWFDKPADRDAADRQLRALRGRTHRLHGGLSVCRDGAQIWHHRAVATLTMRSFSDEFLGDYLDRAGDGILSSVGAYQLEGLGVQLFAAITGDWFTILGLPMLPLLDFLRGHREVAT